MDKAIGRKDVLRMRKVTVDIRHWQKRLGVHVGGHRGSDTISQIKKHGVILRDFCELAECIVLQELAAVCVHDVQVLLKQLGIAHERSLHLPLVLAACIFCVREIQVRKQNQYNEKDNTVRGYHF